MRESSSSRPRFLQVTRSRVWASSSGLLMISVIFAGDAYVELIALVECGLGGGAEDGSGAKIVHEATQAAQDWGEEVIGKSLGFIENDYATGGTMELAAGAGAVGVEGFEETDVSSDDDG